MLRRTWVGAFALAAVMVAACSTTETRLTGITTPGATIDVPTTTTVEETTTTVADTTPVSDESTTTTEESTTTTAPRPEWMPIDPQSAMMPVATPCCGEHFYGVLPSPPLSMPGMPLADGQYVLSGSWPLTPGTPADFTVERFESCEVPGTDGCEGELMPGAMGVDRSQAYSLPLVLDASMWVVLTGYEHLTDDPDTEIGAPAAVGAGVLLDELIAALASAFETHVAIRVRAGEDPYEVYAEIAANPVDGFGDAQVGWPTLTYTFGDAPPIIILGAPEWGPEALHPVALDVQGGQLTISVYGGFTS